MFDPKHVNFPLGSHFNISFNDFPINQYDKSYIKKVPYYNFIGVLMYAIVCNRLDIAYVVSMVSRHMLNLSKNH